MDLFNSALGKNITLVRPAYFIISGFIGIPNAMYYYIFLFFVYIISVVGNTVVMTVIYLDHNLWTPKYIVVFNLAFVDLFGTTALVPKVLDLFLFNNNRISYSDCLTFLFFCYATLMMQILNLIALSYDRLIAITYPLHYQVRVTHRLMFSLIASFWLFAIAMCLTAVGLLTRLSFCKSSVVVNSYFCDHGQIYRQACNDKTPSHIKVYHTILLWLPLCFILGTYVCIVIALTRVATAQERVKALKTCTGHISLVAIYFIPVLISSTMQNLHSNSRIINLSLTSVFPPMLNPIVYVLQTQEIKTSLRKLLKITKQSKIMVRKLLIT
ncbi:olfactory receptor 2A12-like [Solea solea]|uniref:olfactory receptor 2A12-like n=1 Tax=Solea solea TaxID=90069 RepID=UPI00272D6277|nr:olfactory receptor 2A12-like [Solea solea]